MVQRTTKKPPCSNARANDAVAAGDLMSLTRIDVKSRRSRGPGENQERRIGRSRRERQDLPRRSAPLHSRRDHPTRSDRRWQHSYRLRAGGNRPQTLPRTLAYLLPVEWAQDHLSPIHISEPTRRTPISY